MVYKLQAMSCWGQEEGLLERRAQGCSDLGGQGESGTKGIEETRGGALIELCRLHFLAGGAEEGEGGSPG